MTGARKKKLSAKNAKQGAAERRSNTDLREVLDELIAYVRDVANRAEMMGPSEREYAQERLEWLAEEVWRFVMEGPISPHKR